MFIFTLGFDLKEVSGKVIIQVTQVTQEVGFLHQFALAHSEIVTLQDPEGSGISMRKL